MPSYGLLQSGARQGSAIAEEDALPKPDRFPSYHGVFYKGRRYGFSEAIIDKDKDEAVRFRVGNPDVRERFRMRQNPGHGKDSSMLLSVLRVFREMSKGETLRPVAEVHAESKARMKNFFLELGRLPAEDGPKPL